MIFQSVALRENWDEMEAMTGNEVETIEAEVTIDRKKFLDAYDKHCMDRKAYARFGTYPRPQAFNVCVNGHHRQAHIMFEADQSNYLTSVVACYVYAIDKEGTWYDLIVIDMYPARPEPRQQIRDRGTLGWNSPMFHDEARRLIGITI